VSDLIDTTEMYLRTLYELQEEGVVPMRARIAERLGQSGPTVSQTVARMERDGLVTIRDDRHLELTDTGLRLATRVMRRHRIAECMLVQILHLDLASVHAEACRWEHVMSDIVEQRILEIVGHPSVSPFGNPIPGVPVSEETVDASELLPISTFGRDGSEWVTIHRIGESAQDDPALMERFAKARALPGETVKVAASDGGTLVGSAGEYVELTAAIAAHVLVRSARQPASDGQR